MELKGSKAPDYWYKMCATMFSTGQGMAEKLWAHLPQREKVSWELQRMQDRGANYKGVLARTHRLEGAMPPQSLLRAATLLEPEGAPRSQEVRRFEEAVLRLCEHGNWRKW